MTPDRPADPAQYSLLKILTIWALATLPMPMLAFSIGPRMFPGDGWRAGTAIWLLLIGGMVWQFILSLLLLWSEGQCWRWTDLKARLWLGLPRHPVTGRADARLFLWLLATVPVYAVIELGPPGQYLSGLLMSAWPWLATLPDLDLRGLMLPELVGAWWLMGVAVLSCLFNYALGEELSFRGILLPRMRGAFGRWDWLANAVLFGLSHMRRPASVMPIMLGAMAWTLPARRFRCNWFAIIPHALEGMFLLAGVFAVVSGLAFR